MKQESFSSYYDADDDDPAGERGQASRFRRPIKVTCSCSSPCSKTWIDTNNNRSLRAPDEQQVQTTSSTSARTVGELKVNYR